MKTIGIIGGMSPESTVLYYQIINRETNRRLGGNRSAKILLDSVDFEEIVRLQKSGDWAAAGNVLAQSARKLEAGGADFLLLATNTMHKVAAPIAAAVSVPFLHILDAVAQAARVQGFATVGLLGTRFTMQDGFYTDGLAERGIRTLVPDEVEQAEIHRIIFDELCTGQIREDSKRRYLNAIAALAERGAQAVILGCTEIGLLVQQDDTLVPLLDSTEIHVQKAVEFIVQVA